MAIDNETKRKVTEDWLRAFPELSAFTQNKLYKLIGCCVVGIELIKLPNSEEYRPHFVIYSLWKHDAKKCLDAPVLMKQLYNRRRVQFNIPFKTHSTYFDEAVECFKSQIQVSLNGDVALKSLYVFVDSMFNEMLVKTNSAEQAKLFELKYYTALYTGSQSQAADVLSQVVQATRYWNMQMFETWYGKFDLWFQKLQEMASNKEALIMLIENNQNDEKIAKLNRSLLTS